MNQFVRLVTRFLAISAVLGLMAAQAQTLPREVRERIIAATVIIVAGDSLGSGTLISPQGFILTNYHVIGDIATRKVAPRLLVGTIRFVDQPPELRYLAEVVVADPNLDLAVIRITRNSSGQPVSGLSLPAMPIGDSNQLTIGDPIFVFGFQGTGGYTLTFSRGAVGGFTGEDKESGGKQWIKHDAQTGPGNSGGGVYNQDGELVGVHSAGVSGANNSRTAFMRPVSLAWGLVGPNVAGLVGRAGGATTANTGTNAATNAGTNTGMNAAVNAGTAWPPTVAAGQTWQVAVQGGQWTGNWSVAFSGKDGDGDWVGTASTGGRRVEAVLFQRDNILRLNLGGDYPIARCRFDPQNGATLEGKLFLFRSANADSEEIGTCTAVPRGAAASNPASSNTAAVNAAWPPRLAVGQRWQLSVKGDNLNDGGTVALTALDSDGDPKGSITFGNNYQMTAFFYFGKSSGAVLLDLTEASGQNSFVQWLRCRFDNQAFSGTLQGKFQSFSTDKDNNIKDLKDIGTCTVTLGR
ncbi:MAG: serine protease [Meiothermus sp.]|nr:serine protease [Meiothermus sp.]